ncbi:trace amine-associated receptor 13c-like [Denticeps clupeoides]|nr:trace amine-associated receptor 13c-like [Denticeps clupeoides]
MPIHFIMLVESCWLFGALFCALYNMIGFQLTFVSIHNVSLVAVERYIALSNPFLYSKKVSLNVIFIASLMNWAVSLFYNFALLYFNGNFTELEMRPGECLLVIGEVWSAVDLFVVFILPCATMVILYIKIFAIAKRHAVAIRANNKDRRSKDVHAIRSERKAAKVFGILVSVFLICLVPYYVCILMADLIKSQSLYNVLSNILTLFYLNSAINPIIYALFYPWFQKSMKIILTFQIFGSDSSLKNVLRVT